MQLGWRDIGGFSTESESVSEVRQYVHAALLSPSPVSRRYKLPPWWTDTGPVAQSRRSKVRWHGNSLIDLEPRNRKICRLAQMGLPLSAIASRFGLSRQRCGQIRREYQSAEDVSTVMEGRGKCLSSLREGWSSLRSWKPAHWEYSDKRECENWLKSEGLASLPKTRAEIRRFCAGNGPRDRRRERRRDPNLRNGGSLEKGHGRRIREVSVLGVRSGGASRRFPLLRSGGLLSGSSCGTGL